MNKNKKNIHESGDDLQFFYEQMYKNKEELQMLYAKNKMKFPPILQSRNLIVHHFAHSEEKKGSTSSIQRSQSIRNEVMSGRPEGIERKPNICKIVFSKARGNRNMQLNAQSANEKGSIIQTISHSPRKYYLSDDNARNLKFLDQQNSKNTSIQHLLEQLNQTKTKKEAFFLSKGRTNDRSGHSKPIEPLSINRMATLNPQLEDMKIFRQKNHHVDNNSQETLEHLQSLTKRVTLKKDGLLFSKKRELSRRREGLLQPWQHENPQEEEPFLDLRK